jgi:AraC family transcriptional regulator, positive regulator of tynA and feaB
LAQEGTSVARLIQARRLEQCERALANPMQADRTVGDIAYAWGFSDLTHFGRLFKKRFGTTPSEYRRQISRHGAPCEKTRVPRQPCAKAGTKA